MSEVLLETQGKIGYIILNKPEKRNALSTEVVRLMKEYLIKLKTNDDIVIVVIKGNGKSFCSGADLSYIQSLQTNTEEENLADSQSLASLFDLLYRYPKPTFALVQGAALAGGSGIALSCDIVLASEKAKFGFTEVKIGFVPAIVSAIMLHKYTSHLTNELLLSGQIITAEQAYQKQLITAVYSVDTFENNTIEYINQWLTNNSSEAMLMTKQLLLDNSRLSYENGIENAIAVNAKARKNNDCKKGIAAFLNKETPQWT